MACGRGDTWRWRLEGAWGRGVNLGDRNPGQGRGRPGRALQGRRSVPGARRPPPPGGHFLYKPLYFPRMLLSVFCGTHFSGLLNCVFLFHSRRGALDWATFMGLTQRFPQFLQGPGRPTHRRCSSLGLPAGAPSSWRLPGDPQAPSPSRPQAPSRPFALWIYDSAAGWFLSHV